MAGQDSLPYTDPWTVLGVPRNASRDEVKAAFRRAALSCHPDVDPSPSANARFTRIKLAADVLLKGKQQPFMPGAGGGAAAWDPAAAAAQRGSAGWRHRPATLWAGLFAACALAFGYGYSWQWYLQSRRRDAAAARADGPGARGGAGGLPAMQKRKLLQVLADDQAAQHRRQRQAAGARGGGGGGREGGGGGGAG